MDSSNTPFASSPRFYRDRAAEMLNMAELAVTEDARSSYLQLAAHWQELAHKLEAPIR